MSQCKDPQELAGACPRTAAELEPGKGWTRDELAEAIEAKLCGRVRPYDHCQAPIGEHGKKLFKSRGRPRRRPCGAACGPWRPRSSCGTSSVSEPPARSEPVPGTGTRRKGGADRRRRLKHGAAAPNPKLGKIARQHGEAKRRRASWRGTT